MAQAVLQPVPRIRVFGVDRAVIVEIPAISVSSTEIRERLRSGKGETLLERPRVQQRLHAFGQAPRNPQLGLPARLPARLPDGLLGWVLVRLLVHQRTAASAKKARARSVE